jgi:hypothetical protein
MKQLLGLVVCLGLLGFWFSTYASCGEQNDLDPTSLSVGETSLSYSESEGQRFISAFGTVTNTSAFYAEGLVVEAKYFDAENRLTDVIVEPLYGVVVPPSGSVSFRVRDAADKTKEYYVSTSVRVVTAEQRARRQSQAKRQSSVWVDLFISWMPMLLLIGVWVFFMRRQTRKGSPQARTVELIEQQNAILGRQVEVLERLAMASEKSGTEQGNS